MKRHHGIDWAIVGLVALLIAFVGLLSTAIYVVATEDSEPTSRCIDTRWRIFERDGDFSVAEDLTCAK